MLEAIQIWGKMVRAPVRETNIVHRRFLKGSLDLTMATTTRVQMLDD